MEENKRKTLDLDCIDDFEIDFASSLVKDTEKAKAILEEIVSDKSFKGEVRKKILKAIELLED